jgi:uncharacterized membrane protein YphA (DoxX/SURF4 family)
MEGALDDHAADRTGPSHEQQALAVVRVVLGLMLVSTFFENLGKGAYTAAGYKGVIDYYIKNGHSPAIWKAIESVLASNAAIVAPLQAMGELGMGVLLVAGVAIRVVGVAAGGFLFGLWLSELGTSWPWELALYVVAAFCLAWGRAGRAWGVDGLIARRRPAWRLG